MSGSAVAGLMAGMAGLVAVGVLISLLTKEAEGWIDALPRRWSRGSTPASALMNATVSR